MKRFFDIFHLTWINNEVYRTAVGQIHRNLVCVPIVHQKHLHYQNVVAQIQNIELCKAESVSCVIDLNQVEKVFDKVTFTYILLIRSINIIV